MSYLQVTLKDGTKQNYYTESQRTQNQAKIPIAIGIFVILTDKCGNKYYILSETIEDIAEHPDRDEVTEV